MCYQPGWRDIWSRVGLIIALLDAPARSGALWVWGQRVVLALAALSALGRAEAGGPPARTAWLGRVDGHDVHGAQAGRASNGAPSSGTTKVRTGSLYAL